MAGWAWSTLRDSVVGRLIDGQMQQLQNYLAISEKTAPVLAKIATTDATVTTLHTIAIPLDTTVVIQGMVAARRTGGSAGATNDGAGYRVEAVVKNTTGTAALIAAATVTVLGESQAAWDVTVTVSAGNVLIRVTGAANNNISWRWSGRTLSVKEG